MRKFWILASLFLGLVAACETTTPEPTPEPEPQPEAPILTLTSDSLFQFDAFGGEGMLTYTIEHPTQTGVLAVRLSNEADTVWVTNINAQSYGEISFVVEVNEVESSRTSSLVVTYEDLSFEVTIEQEAGERGNSSDYVREATDVLGYYYGTRYSSLPNYYLIFSNVGYDPATDYANPNGWFYKIDCYSKIQPSGDKIQIPVGTYTLDLNNTFADGTFSSSYSKYFTTDEVGMVSGGAMFIAGTMEVAADEINLYLEDQDGYTHKLHWAYDADYSMVDESQSVNDEPEQNEGSGNSNLTADYEVNTENWEVNAYHYGNYYGNGRSNWVFNLRAPERTGDAVNLDIVAGPVGFENGFAGTYSCAIDLSAYTFYPGVYYEPSYTGCWYLHLNKGIISGNQAPFVGGSIVITKNEDGTHTFLIEALDNAEVPNTVTVNWTGTVNVYDMSN